MSAVALLGCLRRRADFDRLLNRRPVVRSAHFAIHHAPARSPHEQRVSDEIGPGGLSTDQEQNLTEPVDNFECLVGCMVPKRHARHAVTRNLIRRQIRESVRQLEPRLDGGHWLVRLTRGWPTAQWTSAASVGLRHAVRGELQGLLNSLPAKVH